MSHKNKVTCKEVSDGKHPWYALHRPRDPVIFKSPKLVGLTTTESLVIGLDDSNNYYAMDNLYLIQLRSKDIKTYLFMIALLNSTLLSVVYKFIAQEEDRILPQVKAENLYLLPIPHIRFGTPENERERIIKEIIKVYKTDLNKLSMWAEFELSENRNDTIHDLLAFLAEKMIEMNKAKNKETKGFLKWLEREIGAEIESLDNKTALKEYHNYDFNELLDILKKNKKKIAIDLSGRQTQERIEKEYNKSMPILDPLKTRIKETDTLIDEIVYSLYGLKDEEIAIVKGV